MLRRILVLAVQLYLTADYCDPLVPGVFFFESDSFFMDSVEAKPAMPVPASPVVRAVLPFREVVEPLAPPATATARPRARVARHVVRSHVVSAPSPGPESAEDH